MTAKSEKTSPDLSNFDPAVVRAEAEGRLSRRMLLIYRAFNALAQEKYAQRGYHGLTAAHTSLMASLEPNGIRIVDLAERMGITKQFAGRLVQELLKIDYVTTQPDPQGCCKVRNAMLSHICLNGFMPKSGQNSPNIATN